MGVAMSRPQLPPRYTSRRYTSRPSPMHPPMRQPPEDERCPAQSLPSASTARRAKDSVQKARHHSRAGITKLKTSLSKRSFGWLPEQVQPVRSLLIRYTHDDLHSNPPLTSRATRDFVILIASSYHNNHSHHTLTATPNDLQLMLRFMRYTHSDQTRRFYIMTDFDVEFTDAKGTRAPITVIQPTKQNIADVIRDTTKWGRSGVIYFGGHGDRDVDGNESYLITTDGERIYGSELRSYIPQSPTNGTIIRIVLDACNVGRFFSELDLPVTYDGVTEPQRGPKSSSGKIILVSSCREDQVAGSRFVGKDKFPHGALVFFLLHNLRGAGGSMPHELTKQLIGDCRLEDTALPVQQPQIYASRHVSSLSLI